MPVETVDWPRLTIGPHTFILRVTFATWHRLAEWGITEIYTDVEFAAACAGNFDQRGKWHSANFKRPQDLADLIVDQVGTGDAAQYIQAVSDAVGDALKKVRRLPGSLPTTEPAAPQKTNGSVPGPSEPLPAD